MSPHACALAAALALGLAPGVSARPFTVEDLLSQSTFGEARIDPSGRTLVYEVRDPYDQRARYDLGDWTGRSGSALRIVDLARPAAAPRPLGPPGLRGVVAGPFSPSGARLAVFRLDGTRYRIGIAEPASGSVRWLAATPLEADRGRTLAWLSDDSLLLLARTDAAAPEGARRGWLAAERLPDHWAKAASGDGAWTALGSGAYASVRRRAAPRRLMRVDARSGAAEVLAQDAFTDLEVSPDGRRVALLVAGDDVQARGGTAVRGAAGSEAVAHHLRILDLEDGRRLAPCPRCDLLPQLLSWSPAGDRLLVFVRGADGLWTSGHLSAVTAGDGRMETLGAGLAPRLDLNPVRIWTDWIGGDPLVLGRAPEADRDDWVRLTAAGPVTLTAELPPPEAMLRVSGPGALVVAAGGALWRVDGRGGARRLAAGVRLAAEPGGDGRPDRGPHARLWVTADVDGRPQLARLDAQGLGPLDLEPAPGELLDIAPSGRAGVWRDIDARGVQRLWLARTGARPVLLAEVNARLADAEVPRVLPIRHQGPAGEPLVSWLYLPARTAPRPPPLLVRPYLGAAYARPPGDRPAEGGLMINLRLLTARGYAVLVPSLPPPPGGLTEPASGLAQRLLDIVEAAAADPAAAGGFDPDRLGLIGFSFGGYSVLAATTQTDRFRAAVAISGVSDLAAYWAGLGPFGYLDPEAGYVGNWRAGAVEATQPRLGGPPWRDPDRYVRNSPFYAADRIHTPLMLVHGALDPVPHAGSEALYAALFRQGKDALFVTYWGALHGLASPGDVRDFHGRVFAFLERWLGPVTSGPPAGSPEPASASGGPRPPPPAP